MDLLTTVLELAGLTLLIAALMVLLWPVAPAGALAAGGVACMAASWLLVGRRGGARR